MSLSIDIRGTSNTERAQESLASTAPFGAVMADLMVQMHHDQQRGWHDAAVVPYGPLSISPAAKVLHYGQSIFEGHKAYAWDGGKVALFRPDLHVQRLNRSAARMQLPEIPTELQLQALELLLDLLRAWVPTTPGASLYLRPTLIGTEPSLGVATSRTHEYLLLASPVRGYFAGGDVAISVVVEDTQVRAVPGGVGTVKTGGNYAAGMQALTRARAAGFDQVLWLDAVQRRYVEELNAMNLFAVIDGELVTPTPGDTILHGITRRSILELAAHRGIRASEQRIAIDQLIADLDSGRASELFAVGTAAVVTSIGSLTRDGKSHIIGDGKPGPKAKEIRTAITDIQYGRTPDVLGWMSIVPERTPQP